MTDRPTRLREARIAAGFTSASAAASAHKWGVSTYLAHENGQNDFDADWAKVYAQAFNTDAGWLLLGKHLLGGDKADPTTGRKTFGDLLREERERRGWSQADVGSRLNVTRAAVSQWEKNQMRPGIDMLAALSKLFDVPADRLLALLDPTAALPADSAANVAQVDPVLEAVWRKMTAAQRRKLIQIGLIISEE
jgi:transcriptional regulator with XRE-family HTH domain